MTDQPASDQPLTEQPAGGAAAVPGRLVSRAVWTTADQAVSSLTNAALTVVIAASVSAPAFGTFALAFSVYVFLLGVAQAIGPQVVVIRFSGKEGPERDRAVAWAGASSLVVGLLGTAVLGLTALLVDLPSERVLLVVGVLLPPLLLQDTWRTVLVARGAPQKAFAMDVLWTLVQLVAITVLVLRRVDGPSGYVAVWGLASLVAALLGVRLVRQRPVLAGTTRFLRDHQETSKYLLAQWVAVLGATQVAFVAVAAIGTVEAVGSLRAAQTLLGPLNIVGLAATSFAVPEMVRRDLDARRLTQVAVGLSALLVLVDLVWGAVLLLLPDAAGQALLGDTWDSARDALPGMVVFTCAIGATVGASAVFRAVDQTRYIFYTSAALGPLVLLLSVAGQYTGGTQGAALGFAAAALLVIPLTWVLLGRALRQVRTVGAPDRATGPVPPAR